MKKLLILIAIFAASAGFYAASAQTSAPGSTSVGVRTVEVEKNAKTFALPPFSAARNAESYSLYAEIDGKKVLLKSGQKQPLFEALDASLFKKGVSYKFIVAAENRFGASESNFFFTVTEKEVPQMEFTLSDSLILNAAQDIYTKYYEAKGVPQGAFITALTDVRNEATQSIRAKAAYSFTAENVKEILGTTDSKRAELVQNIRQSERAGKKVSFAEDSSRVSPVFGQYVPPAAPVSFTKKATNFFSGIVNIFSRRPAEVVAPATGVEFRVVAKKADIESIKKDLERVQYFERQGLVSVADINGLANELKTKSVAEKVQAKKTAYDIIGAIVSEIPKWGIEQDVDQTVYLITETAKNLISGSKGKRLTGDALTQALNDIYQKNLEQYKKQFEILNSKGGTGEPALIQYCIVGGGCYGTQLECLNNTSDINPHELDCSPSL